MRSVVFTCVLLASDCGDTCPTAGPCPDGGTDGSTGGPSYPATLVHTDAFGTATAVDGTVSVVLDPMGRESKLTEIAVSQPVVMVVDQREVSLITGYPLGTTVELTSIGLLSSIPLDLDGAGTGRIAAGVPLVLDVTVTEPRDLAVRETLYAELPWDLVVTATERGFSVDPWSDGFGGRLEVR
jgi:hypothetical protein